MIIFLRGIMTQSEIAQEVGCHADSIGRWEKGVPPMANYRQKIVKLFKRKMKDIEKTKKAFEQKNFEISDTQKKRDPINLF